MPLKRRCGQCSAAWPVWHVQSLIISVHCDLEQQCSDTQWPLERLPTHLALSNYGILAAGIPEFFNELHAYNMVYATCPDLAKRPWVWSCSSLASGSVSISSSKSPWWIPEAGQRQTKHLSMHTSETIRIQHFYKYLFPSFPNLVHTRYTKKCCQTISLPVSDAAKAPGFDICHVSLVFPQMKRHDITESWRLDIFLDFPLTLGTLFEKHYHIQNQIAIVCTASRPTQVPIWLGRCFNHPPESQIWS